MTDEFDDWGMEDDEQPDRIGAAAIAAGIFFFTFLIGLLGGLILGALAAFGIGKSR